MNFEDRLKEVAQKYAVLSSTHPVDGAEFPQQAALLLSETLNATEYRFDKNPLFPYSKAMLIPLSHSADLGNTDTSHEQNQDSGNPSAQRIEDRLVEISFIHYCGRFQFDNPLTKIAIQSNPGFTLPNIESIDKITGEYKFNMENGRLFVANILRDGRGQYLPNWGGEELEQCLRIALEAHISTWCDSVEWVKFPVTTLGRGVLSSFFQDLGYGGLENLSMKLDKK